MNPKLPVPSCLPRCPVPKTARDLVRVLVGVLEAKGCHIAQHSAAVSRWTIAVCEALGIPRQQHSWLTIAARVHDIGLMSIPDLVLLKPSPLSDAETGLVRAHPVVGGYILNTLALPEFVSQAVLSHHERLDGSGYPQQLDRAGIPFAARVIAVADVFEAMTADRPWRRAMPKSKAVGRLRAMAGHKLDAVIVEALIAQLDQANEVKHDH